jgi:hypothetical protein
MGLFSGSKTKVLWDRPPEYAQQYSQNLSGMLSDYYKSLQGDRGEWEGYQGGLISKALGDEGMSEAQKQASGYYGGVMARGPQYYMGPENRYDERLSTMLQQIEQAGEEAMTEASRGGIGYGLNPSNSGKVQKSIMEGLLSKNLAGAEARANVERQKQEDLQRALQMSTQAGMGAAQGMQQMPGLSEILAQMGLLKGLPYSGELDALQTMMKFNPIYAKPIGKIEEEAGPGWGMLSSLMGAAGPMLSGNPLGSLSSLLKLGSPAAIPGGGSWIGPDWSNESDW